MLRPLTVDDYPLLVRWQNDPQIARWMDYRTPFTQRDVAHDQQRAAAEGYPMIIELDGSAVGKCGLNQFKETTLECALYVYVGETDVWGRGVGRDACMALLVWCFDHLDRRRVELTLLSDNVRARTTYERCGFVLDPARRGRSYRLGRWRDTQVMAVTAGRFEAVRAGYGI